MLKEDHKNIIISILAILAITTLITLALNIIRTQNQQEKQTFFVIEVEDGDTFLIETGEYVRLICIDTPEYNQTNYTEAKNYLKTLILGKQVRLEQDISGENLDKYSRLLRYAYIKIDNQEVFINKELVQNGYAKIYPYGNSTSKCNEIAAK